MPARVALPGCKCTAPGASSPSLWPPACSRPAADSRPAFPLWGGEGTVPPPRPHTAQPSWTRPRHPAYPSAGSASKIKPCRESRPRRWACTVHVTRSPPAPMGPPAAAHPKWGASFGCSPGAGRGTPLAKCWCSWLCRLSSCGAGFPMGNRHGGVGEKTTPAARGLSGGIC